MYISRLIVVVALLFPSLAWANEAINSFDTTITPYSDGSFLVEETIVYDFDGEFRHGIFRDINLEHSSPASAWYKNRSIDVSLRNVSMDGSDVPYSVSESSNNYQVKIGDANQIITGVHSYQIDYQVKGGLTYYDDGAVDLYWNATGNDWPVPIYTASVTVINNKGMLTGQQSCYFGAPGATTNCKINTDSEEAIVFQTSGLDIGHGLTIAAALDKTKVAKQVYETINYWPFVFLFLFGALIAYFWFIYQYKTKYKSSLPVIAQYEPYNYVKPMFSGYLIDGRLDSRDITAGLVYLAETGFIKIRKTETKVLLMFPVDDYEITLKRPVSEVDDDYSFQVLSLLFLIDAEVGSTVKLSKLKSTKRSENAGKVQDLRQAITKEVEKQGYFEKQVPRWAKWVVGGLSLLSLIYLIFYLDRFPKALAIALVVVWLISFSLFFIFRRRTKKGYEAANHLKGFKEFLSVTDKERFKFHNAPEKSPEQFMQYLPYAIAFGVEKEWAEVFKDITIATPDWYEGQGAFSAVVLTNDIGAFSDSFTGATTNSSSSSGGGFSGGGVGGGGGGSW